MAGHPGTFLPPPTALTDVQLEQPQQEEKENEYEEVTESASGILSLAAEDGR